MAQQKIPTQPTVKTIQYANLLGVDYQSDPTEVSRQHSPEMVNMISDLGGNPVKRCGYRQVGTSVSYEGISTVGGSDWAVKLVQATPNSDEYRLHAVKIDVDENGEMVESLDTEISTRTNYGEVKHVFGYQGYLYILCENEWIEFDTETRLSTSLGTSEGVMWEYASATTIALYEPDFRYIPTVYSMFKPNGQEMVALPEGTDITGFTQGVNLLTPFRSIEYCVTTETADETVFVIPNQAKMSGVMTVEILDSNTYEWLPVNTFTTSGSTTLACRRPDNVRNVTTTVIDAKITFNSAPYITVTVNDEPHLRFRGAQSVEVPAGVPNVRITYAPFNMTEYESSGGTVIYNGYYRKERNGIFATSAAEFFDSRLFAAYGIRTYYSRAIEPMKIDDNYYFDVDNEVVSYTKTSSSIAIVSEDTGKNTIYLASGSYDSTLGMTVYTIKASNTTVGAVSSNVSGSMNDESIFLSKLGLFGMSSNYLSEKYAIPRSGKINRRLCKEPNLESAVGTNFNGYFYLAINGHMYVLDSRHKDASRNGDNSYECYYFDNLPIITSMYVVNNRMYFSDGTNTYTWNDDLDEQYKYLDNAVMNSQTYVWSGTPVKCKWCSTIDGDGAPHYYKTLQKKGTMVTISPPMQTSCQITLIRNAHDVVYVGRFNGSTFALSDSALDAFTKKKIKKYKRLQFVVENNEPEAFGIISIVKSFVLNNYAKR